MLHSSESSKNELPDYLRSFYSWAYLTPWLAKIFDRQVIVQTILWGNAQKLIKEVLSELKPGDQVFQPAAVYGNFSLQVAGRIGEEGRLEVRDIAPLQVNLTRRKLANISQAHIKLGDAAAPVEEKTFDAVTCFFLLHEVPDELKVRIIVAMLSLVRPGGKVVFVDYHRPHRWHPLKPVMLKIFDYLEPFAGSMWNKEIQEWAGPLPNEEFTWSKRNRFGGLYQIVVAKRK